MSGDLNVSFILSRQHRQDTSAVYTVPTQYPLVLDGRYELSVESWSMSSNMNIMHECSMTVWTTGTRRLSYTMHLPPRAHAKPAIFKTWLMQLIRDNVHLRLFFDGHTDAIDINYDESRRRYSVRYTPPAREGVEFYMRFSETLSKKMGFTDAQQPFVPRRDDEEDEETMVAPTTPYVAAYPPILAWGSEFAMVLMPNAAGLTCVANTYVAAVTPMTPLDYGIEAVESGHTPAQLTRKREYVGAHKMYVQCKMHVVNEWKFIIVNERLQPIEWLRDARDTTCIHVLLQRVGDR